MRIAALCLLLFAALLAAVRPAGAAQHRQALVSQTIQYLNPDAGAVDLVWAVNGWQLPPDEPRPAGTSLFAADKPMLRSPMMQSAGAFVATLQVPRGTKIDYIFHITKTQSGMPIDVWDIHAPEQQFTIVADQSATTDVQATVPLAQQIYSSESDIELQLIGIVALGCVGMLLMIVVLRLGRQPLFLDL